MKGLNRCKTGGQILLIPKEDIVANPRQPRKHFDIDELDNLADSIRQNGIIQPLNVRLLENGKYEVIAGERRFRAAKMIGLTRIPCILMDAGDEKSAIYALLENMQRQDLGFFEEAMGIEQLMINFGIGQETIAKRLGFSQSTISNKLRILRLPDDIRAEILKEDLTERHARALLSLKNDTQRREALAIIIDKRLNVNETDKLVTQMLQQDDIVRRAPTKIFKDVRIFLNTLNHAVDTMRRAGIDADSEKSETEDYIEYVVRIPKSGDGKIREGRPGA